MPSRTSARLLALLGLFVLGYTLGMPLHSATSVPLSDEPHRVLYQLYVESFQDGTLKTGTGDFLGLESRLDYLQELGITGVLLMPIFESTGGMGYSVVDFDLLRPSYAGSKVAQEQETTFKKLISSAHQRNIKVYVDAPINHISRESTWFKNSEKRLPGFEDFFLWSDLPVPGWKIPRSPESGPKDVWHFSPTRKQYVYGLFGSSIPDLNHRELKVQQETLRILRKYSDWGVDGYRIDAAKHLVEGKDNLNPVHPDNVAMLRYYLKEVRKTHPHVSFLLEAWSNKFEEFEPYLPDAGDVAFDFAYMETVRDSVVHHHPWAVRNALKHLEEVQSQYLPGNRIVFSGNHDIPRVRTLFQNDQARVELSEALTLLLPYTPLIYYGTEIFMPGDYLRPPAPKPTTNEVCTPMAWTAGPNAGFTGASLKLGDTWNKKLHSDYASYNVATLDQKNDSLFKWIKSVISARKKLNISNQTRMFVDNQNPSDPVLKIALKLDNGRCVVALYNFAQEKQVRRETRFPSICEPAGFQTLLSRRARTDSQWTVELDKSGIWMGEAKF